MLKIEIKQFFFMEPSQLNKAVLIMGMFPEFYGDFKTPRRGYLINSGILEMNLARKLFIHLKRN